MCEAILDTEEKGPRLLSHAGDVLGPKVIRDVVSDPFGADAPARLCLRASIRGGIKGAHQIGVAEIVKVGDRR